MHRFDEGREKVSRPSGCDGQAVSTRSRGALDGEHDRHLAAVARSLGWAQESAQRGDYADALGWVQVLEAIGDTVPLEFETKREEWLRALADSRAR